MVRRVGFGGNKPPENRASRLRAERKLEKFHLEGAHDPEPKNKGNSTAPQTPQPSEPNHGRKRVSSWRTIFNIILALWILSLVVSFLPDFGRSNLSSDGFGPSGFVRLAFMGILVYWAIKLLKKNLFGPKG